MLTLTDYFFTSKRAWYFWLFVALFIIFTIWIFAGGGEHEYVGYKPLHPDVDANNYMDTRAYRPHEEFDPLQDINNLSEESTEYSTEEPSIETEEFEIFLDDYDTDLPLKYRSPSARLSSSRSNTRLEQSSLDSGLSDVSFINPPNADPYVKQSKWTQQQIDLSLGPYKSYVCSKQSKPELRCREILEEIYGEPFFCIRPDFLKNPETKRNCELDCYNHELGIALEYNGPTHYTWPNWTGQTKEQFIQQVRRDQFKIKSCDANGVYLITVPYNVPNHKLKDYITYYLPENELKRQLAKH